MCVKGFFDEFNTLKKVYLTFLCIDYYIKTKAKCGGVVKSSLSKITEMKELTKQVHMSIIGENRMVITRYEQLLWLSETEIRMH